MATWEYWDEIAQVRYGGALGQKLGRDIANHGTCPLCGFTEGELVDEDDEDWDC